MSSPTVAVRAPRGVRSSLLFVLVTAILVAAASPATAQSDRRHAVATRSVKGAVIAVSPTHGPGGTHVRVQGSGFSTRQCGGAVTFADAAGTVKTVGNFSGPTFDIVAKIPKRAAVGPGTIQAHQIIPDPRFGCLPQYVHHLIADTSFNVTA